MAVVDQLLAAITRDGDSTALDAALDFRLLLAGSRDPAAVIRGYFILRSAIEEHHYLACYRLRRWLEQHFVALVHADRSERAQRVGLKLDVPSFGSLYAHCAVAATQGRPPTPWSRVHFVPADSADVLIAAGQALPSG